MVTAWRAQLAEQPHLARYSARPDGTPHPEYSAASKPRFDRWIIDACTRPLDHAWLDYQHEIGLRDTRHKKNTTDHADSLDHIPLRYLLAFTAVVITSSRTYLAAKGHPDEQVDRMHAAFTKSVMLHVTVWTRPYIATENWSSRRCPARPADGYHPRAINPTPIHREGEGADVIERSREADAFLTCVDRTRQRRRR